MKEKIKIYFRDRFFGERTKNVSNRQSWSKVLKRPMWLVWLFSALSPFCLYSPFWLVGTLVQLTFMAVLALLGQLDLFGQTFKPANWPFFQPGASLVLYWPVSPFGLRVRFVLPGYLAHFVWHG